MTVKQYLIDFKGLSIDSKMGLKDYSALYKNGIRLKELLKNRSVKNDIKSGRTPSRFNADYWNGEYEFMTMSDVDKVVFSLNKECVDKITDYAIEQENTLYQVQENSLIISNAMTLGLSFLTDRPVYINQNVFYVNLDESKINKKFILWYFNHIIRPLFQTTYSSKYLSKDELGRINIPNIGKIKQDKFAAIIKPVEQKINKLKLQMQDPQQVINVVFAREFGFHIDKFEQLKKIKSYDTDLATFSNNKDIRNSVKFHRKAGSFVIEELNKITNKKIKDYVSEPIVLGASISPSNFDTNGDYYYISMATVKNLRLEIDATQLVSNSYAKANITKSIRKNDIIMTRSGVAIGKFALVENDDIDGIFADFTMRIRLQNYNYRFAYYYFRTSYFQYLIEVNKKGLQNQNIFPSMVQEFPIIDIELDEQQRIVDEIKKELDKQDEIKKQIEDYRNKICESIETIIKEI